MMSDLSRPVSLKLFSQKETRHLWFITLKMEPHFRNYQINHKSQEKDKEYHCLKLRKKESKTLNTFQKLLE